MTARTFWLHRKAPGSREFLGRAICPECGNNVGIVAREVDTENKQTRHEGRTLKWQDYIRQQFVAPTPNTQGDLVEQAAGAPFDDSLEGVG